MLLAHRLRLTGSDAYQANAVDFDGTNDYLARGAALTGSADDFRGLLSAWVRLDGGDNALQYILSDGAPGSSHYTLSRDTNNKFRVDVFNSGITTQFSFTTVATYAASATWLHVLAAWNTNFSAGNKIGQIYINGVSDVTVTNDSHAAFNANYTNTNCFVGADAAANNKFNGCLGELYFAPAQYLDISNSSNRLLFRKASGKPQRLGSTGATPTATAPLLYLKNPAASFGTNSGTGGDLTVTGTLDVASTSPSD